MSVSGLHPAIRHLIRSVADPGAEDRPDADLLRRFTAGRDEEAFAALVCRHGGLVFDVCRCVLGNDADAEDAFQATFLVLARNAGSVRSPGSLAAWLYGVAVRTAHKARTANARRRRCEVEFQPLPEVPTDPSWSEVRRVLHEELHGLSERYRSVLVLCYLRGLTQAAAAAVLGVSPAAVKKRLERGREKLRVSLVRRGLGPTAMLAAVTVPVGAAPEELIASTSRLGFAAAGTVPAHINQLVAGGLTTMFRTKLTAGLSALAVAATGAVLLGSGGPASPAPAAARVEEKNPAERVAGQLTGEWIVTRVETNGKTIYSDEVRFEMWLNRWQDEAPPAARIIFDGDRAEVKYLDVSFVRNFSFKLDPTPSPKEIDVTFLAGPMKGKSFAGIYIAREAEVRICLRLEQTERGRPRGFSTVGKAGLYTLILKPATKSDGPGPAPARRDGADPAPTFDLVRLAGKDLHLVLTRPEGETFRDSLTVVGRHLDLALLAAERFKALDATMIFYIRTGPTATTGSYSGFTREQVQKIAALPAGDRAAKLLEHAWSLGRLPKDAEPLPPGPPSGKSDSVGPTPDPGPAPKGVSVYDKIHTRADLPVPGEMVPSPKDKSVIYYITNRLRMWGEKANVGKHSGLYISGDGGKTWLLLCTKFEFEKLFVHPGTGHLFAVIASEWLGTDEKDGTLQHYSSNKVITSADGEKWKDITGARGYITDLTGIFADPEHPGRVCLRARAIREYVLQAKDDRYSDWNWLRVDRPEGKRLLDRLAPPGE
ncbi:MAG: sigE 25 [Gemmataceae bacterium]|nr:sigE 25 [Gemmataceae bacterium]